MSKLVKSTRSLDEHVENLLAVREAKDEGRSDREVCNALGISVSTLMNYKRLLAKQDLSTLGEDYQNEKRCELDSQVQTVVKKLVTTVQVMEEDHNRISTEVNRLIENNKDMSDREKINLKRMTRYPVENITSIQKLLLDAVELRSRIWGLDRDGKNGTQIVNNRKIVFEVSHKTSTDIQKINAIADTLIGANDGM